MRSRVLLPVVAVLAVGLGVYWTLPTPPARDRGGLVGRAGCAACHPREAEAFSGSHHDLAMDEPSPATVLGNFGGATLRHFDVTTTFTRNGPGYAVFTDGPDGGMREFPVRYTFGHFPLQQYLLPLADGRLQALSLAWDSRPREQGGQRWFPLYPDERIAAGDELHWTGLQQNWNYMCAECHSTGLHKGYDAGRGHYATTWSEIDVSCEACHGAAGPHQQWAERAAHEPGLAAPAHHAFEAGFDQRRGVTWTTDPATGLPHRSRPPGEAVEVEACARCHARRTQFAEDWRPGRPLLDTHQPALLTAGLYWPDGQMRDEVYNWGSFLQSRMHRAGVTCSDCHDPHSGRPRQPGNLVCLQCHERRFDTKAHHFHQEGTEAAACTACHAPTVTYMGVDRRHDHSFRIPRPDLAAGLSVPDACTGCHRDRKPEWASGQLQQWYGRLRTDRATFAAAFAADDAHGPDQEGPLLQVAADAEAAPIVRASALHRLARPLSATAVAAALAAVADPEPLLRWVAAEALTDAEPAARLPLRALLADPVRGVRIAAAQALADVPAAAADAALAPALAELEASFATNADRPEAHLLAAALRHRQGRDAEAELHQALRLQPHCVPAFVNLADFARERGDENACERWLRDGLSAVPTAAPLHHALGLALVRQGRARDALPSLQRACELAPADARYVLVWAVALRELGQAAAAVTALQAACARLPQAKELVAESVAALQAAGDAAGARAKAAEYVGRWPGDAVAARLRAEVLR